MAVSGSHGHGQERETVKREDEDGNSLPPPPDSDEAKVHGLVGPGGESLNGQGEEERPPYEMDAEGAVPAITAFIIYQQPDGKWLADNDLDKVYIVQRAAHHEDMYPACKVVAKDIEIIQTTHSLINAQMQVSAQVAQQQQQNDIANTIAKRGGFRTGGPYRG